MKDVTKIGFASALASLLVSTAVAQSPLPTFRPETIDSQVIIGYGTAIGDVDGDGKPDILLADKKQFVWYQNPDWKRHVIVENLTEHDNVCIAARDIDGDGKVEIAVGAQWNPGDTVNSGSVHYLVPPEDRTQMWTPIQLPHEPVVHRMRWVRISRHEFVLVVAPLHGRGNQGGQGAGAKLIAYHVPETATSPWTTEVLDDQFHVTHNFDVGVWDPESDSEAIFYLGKEGAKLIFRRDEKWVQKPLKNVQGGGEIRWGKLTDKSTYLTTIEPFHGTHLVIYQPAGQRPEDPETVRTEFSNRVVLDEKFNQGHAIAVGDLFGNGSQQIVAGWRNPNEERTIGVKIYFPDDEKPGSWKSAFIDENGMACEDLRIGDLDGDGRLDIVAAGRSTHNLKVYWNEGKK